MKNVCMKCMTGTINEEGKCTNCGAINATEKNGSMQLPVRAILKGKYLVGRVIGESGLGITYIGYDQELKKRVAIKEFYPKYNARRMSADGITICPYDEGTAEEFESEKENFINEARILEKFRNEDGVVSVMDYFMENGTAYIVMEYIDGFTLKSYAGKTMSMAEALKVFKPVMETLAKIHNAGIIHRDICPENIVISKDFTKAYLIDFGTAEDVKNGHNMSNYCKSFYSPIEQRCAQTSDKMQQGTWTDVYALCVTIYGCITGRVMSDSVSRLMEDDIIMPRELGVDISPAMEAVLMKGLAVRPEERIQSMEELMQMLYN